MLFDLVVVIVGAGGEEAGNRRGSRGGPSRGVEVERGRERRGREAVGVHKVGRREEHVDAGHRAVRGGDHERGQRLRAARRGTPWRVLVDEGGARGGELPEPHRVVVGFVPRHGLVGEGGARSEELLKPRRIVVGLVPGVVLIDGGEVEARGS